MMANFLDLLPTLLITGLGGYFAYQQARANKKRDIITEYLIKAYRAIESASHNPSFTSNRNLEQAIADIQLLGSQKQIILAREFANEMGDKQKIETTQLFVHRYDKN